MLGFLKEKIAGGAKRLNGRADLLEAACAACVLVGAADGNLDVDEAGVALDRLLSHDTLSKAFTGTHIEAAFDKQAKRAKAGISGRVGLKREVEEARAKSTAEDLEMVFVIVIDVAGADGQIGDKEMKALRDLGQTLGGLSPDRYLN
ncbi:tellurite resistance TerB family protein [Paenibacillus sp. AK121]|uniref:tellurite resistance TerB family protein n=1 Tax=Paenibacillus sp. AK121 TaxID=2849670 RepID=UPI001C24563A|nr:tellurite resistance TerB family protein [Paenibacillus sp. AK121]MBU9710136.1 tellurite resistance TerB family protein [Paenibacillus sp. AK121]